MKQLKNYNVHFKDIDEIVSMTECTGLIPALPSSDNEAESYRDIYKISKQKKN